MKAYTDIEQSKKLAEILPIESADMWWLYVTSQGKHIAMMYEEPDPHYLARMESYGIKNAAIPCWSLAALLGLIKSEIYGENVYGDTVTYKVNFRKYKFTDDIDLYQIAYGNYKWHEDGSNSWKDMVNTGEKENLIDAAFEMVVWLKENNKI